MKKIICFLFLCCSILSTNAQWIEETSKTTNSLLGIAYPSETVGYSCGLNGTILKTVNGGHSWQLTKSTVQSALYATAFANTDTGIAVGDNGTIVLTENTGLDWAISPTPVSKAWRFCKYYNKTFFVGGQDGYLLTSTDFGKTWQQKVIAPINIYDLFFLDEKIWYLSGSNSSVYKTSNAGLTWTQLGNIASSGQIIISVCFLDENNGFISGSGGTLMKTTNSGQSWSNAFTDVTSSHLSSIRFIDSSRGICIGGNVSNNTSTVIVTEDGGNTWNYDTTLSTSRLYGFTSSSSNKVSVVGINGVIYSGNPIGFSDSTTSGIISNNESSKKQAQLLVYPNPTNTNTVTLAYQNKTINEVVNYSIYDLTGRLIKNGSSSNNELEITDMSAGVYSVTINYNNTQLSTLLSIVK